MAEQLDAGDIISRKAIAINSHTYVGDVLAQANIDAPLLFEDALSKLMQDEHYILEKGSTDGLRCYPRLPEDGLIHWNDSAVHIHRLVRASSRPFQGAFTYYRGSKAIIWKASLVPATSQWLAVPGHIIQIDKTAGTITVATGDGLLMIEEMEWEGVSGKPTQWCKSIRERFSNRHHAHE
jgi:methionyl-tRNA formyltransferase